MKLMSMIIAVMMAMAMVMGSQSAKAGGLDQEMQDAFDSMVNVTEPGAVSNSRRGIIYGGGVQIRNNTMSANLLGWTAPRFSGGCGGLDLFGGSFSVISSDQIVAMLRSIASNAVGYMFQLALKTISAEIQQLLQDFMNQLMSQNIMQLNSCEIGMSIVDSMRGAGESAKRERQAEESSIATGRKDDGAEAGNQGRDESPATEAATADPAVANAIIPGNHVWEALKLQEARFGDRYPREQLMSLIGSTVVCAPSTPGCTSGTSLGREELTAKAVPAILSLEHLVVGSERFKNVTVYQCDSANDCLNPVQVPYDFPGMQAMIEEILLGPNNAPGEGMISRQLMNGTTPTALERGLMTSQSELVTMALQLAINDQRGARDFVKQFSIEIAAEVTGALAVEAIDNVIASVGAYRQGEAVETIELLLERREYIETERLRLTAINGGRAARFEQYLARMNGGPRMQAPIVTQLR